MGGNLIRKSLNGYADRADLEKAGVNPWKSAKRKLM
jgi:hypothetical protein